MFYVAKGAVGIFAIQNVACVMSQVANSSGRRNVDCVDRRFVLMTASQRVVYPLMHVPVTVVCSPAAHPAGPPVLVGGRLLFVIRECFARWLQNVVCIHSDRSLSDSEAVARPWPPQSSAEERMKIKAVQSDACLHVLRKVFCVS